MYKMYPETFSLTVRSSTQTEKGYSSNNSANLSKGPIAPRWCLHTSNIDQDKVPKTALIISLRQHFSSDHLTLTAKPKGI